MYFVLLNSLFILSSSSINSTCKYYINSPYGLKQFFGEIGPRENICINISLSDYFIIFNRAPDDLKIYEYHSSLNGTNVTYYSEYYLRDISIYSHIKALFAFQIITSYKGGIVSFSYGTLPDICKTGIFFTNNLYIESIFLSGSQNPPYKIGVNDDLCVVSTVQTSQAFSVDMQTELCCDKLFVYQSMKPVEAFSGSVSETFVINATNEPVLLRFVSDNKAEDSKYVKIGMGSTGDFPFESGIIFYNPQDQVQPDCPKSKCTFSQFFHIKIIIIVIIALIGTAIVFSIIFYITARCCCPYYVMFSVQPSKDHKNIWQSNNQVVEDRGEPQGYFALDPILRPR